MAIVPKKKRSQAKKRTRHSTWETINLKRLDNNVNLVTCKNCGTKVLGHRVCKNCGFYAGKQIITIKTKASKAKVIDAE